MKEKIKSMIENFKAGPVFGFLLAMVVVLAVAATPLLTGKDRNIPGRDFFTTMTTADANTIHDWILNSGLNTNTVLQSAGLTQVITNYGAGVTNISAYANGFITNNTRVP